MLTVNEIADNACLKGLVNAYTGKPVEVRIVYLGGKMFFLSTETYSPAHWVNTLEELVEHASSRNGVIGAADDNNTFVCPYTGVRMSPVKDVPGFRMTGGWDPALPVSSAAEFAYRCRMRGGVADLKAPKPGPEGKHVIKVLGVKEEPETPRAKMEISADAGEAAERTVHELRKTAGRGRPRVVRP